VFGNHSTISTLVQSCLILLNARQAPLVIEHGATHFIGGPVYCNWEHTVYGGIAEELPQKVCIMTYKDANLMHDLVTGQSMTGIIHLLNQTQIHWYSRKQASVETVMYGSEFVAAKIAMEQIMDLRYTIRMLKYRLTDLHGCSEITKVPSRRLLFHTHH
jgi:hypothetical protein